MSERLINSLKAPLLALSTLGLVAGGWWYHYTGTPQYSLTVLAQAVKAKDYETARYFVDEDRIAETASKSVLETVRTRLANETKARDNPSSGIGLVAFQLMAPRIKEAARNDIKEAIRIYLGANETLTDKGDLQQLHFGMFSHLHIDDCVVSGNTAEVVVGGIANHNFSEITVAHLRLARIRNSRDWRIEEVTEFVQAYLKMVDALKDSGGNGEPVTLSQRSGPAIVVSKPNRVLDLNTEYGVCGIDYLNSPVVDGDRTVPLNNGEYETLAPNELVRVQHVFCLDNGVAEHALLATDWTSCGGSCGSSGIVQVFELRSGHPVVVQQMDFDSHAEGTGATFDNASLSLTITGRSEDNSPHCCPRNLDVVTYQWQGHEFVQTAYKRVPVMSP